ncbi:hypothetical protein FB451DRAFT_1284464 [Mycena latifolia]|nr:hypothetical protein FB451DRAFT_1284464 [Mycena latifolia]
MQRPLISYDDITLPYQPTAPRDPPASSPSNASQSKKRKWSNQKTSQQQANQNAQAAPAAKTAPAAEEEEDGDDGDDAENRYLTSEEIWDDSALIDAWNAATEEYEAFNGPDKGWKNEPVHKSPLWYNVPPIKPSPKKKQKTEDRDTADAQLPPEEADSQPLDFATFVPSYDASLALPTPEYGDAGAGYDYSTLPPPGASVATQDEAFARALGAMYWGGYWTAVYHVGSVVSFFHDTR